MATLSSSAAFTVAAQNALITEVSTVVMPAVSNPQGSNQGRIVHPTLGTFDYEYAPDEWTNIDGDLIIMPTFASTKSLQGASNSLFQGNVRDVMCEERWKSLGGLAMPVSQLRTLLACAMNPIDPSVGYMQWFPNYTTGIGYNVLLLDVVVGSAGSPVMAALSGFKSQAMVLNDVVNAYGGDDPNTPYGWILDPVTVFWKMISKVNQ